MNLTNDDGALTSAADTAFVAPLDTKVNTAGKPVLTRDDVRDMRLVALKLLVTAETLQLELLDDEPEAAA